MQQPLGMALFCACLVPALAAQNCTRTSTGLVPLSDLGLAKYKTYEGGLYPGGLNVLGGAHQVAVLGTASHIVPRDTRGLPSATGKIVLVSIGMSNTTQEFSAFVTLANADKRKNPPVLLVDGAQGGQAAGDITSPTARFWTVLAQRLARGGITPAQVSVAWIKQAERRPTRAFPTEAKRLQADLETICNILKSKFPNLALTYLSSRIYAGYATSTLNPEPHAYESAFSVKWLIQDQIAGKPALNFDPKRGAVKASLLLWGPYLWADGTKGRKIDALTWLCTDFRSDGTHPSTTGRQKVASLLLGFFTRDASATPWFVTGRGTLGTVKADLALVGKGTAGASGLPELAAANLPQVPSPAPFALRVTRGKPAAPVYLAMGVAPASFAYLGGTGYLVPLTVLQAMNDAFGHAELTIGSFPPLAGLVGLPLRWQAGVLDASAPTGVATLTPGLVTTLGH